MYGGTKASIPYEAGIFGLDQNARTIEVVMEIDCKFFVPSIDDFVWIFERGTVFILYPLLDVGERIYRPLRPRYTYLRDGRRRRNVDLREDNFPRQEDIATMEWQ